MGNNSDFTLKIVRLAILFISFYLLRVAEDLRFYANLHDKESVCEIYKQLSCFLCIIFANMPQVWDKCGLMQERAESFGIWGLESTTIGY